MIRRIGEVLSFEAQGAAALVRVVPLPAMPSRKLPV